MWSQRLAEVADDLESQYLRAQKASLDFAFEVEGKGKL